MLDDQNISNESNEILERIIDACPFKNDSELTSYLLTAIRDYDLIDLLEKLVCLRFFLQTDRLKCDENKRSYLRNLFNDGFAFMLPFLLCYVTYSGNNKIQYEDLYTICEKIDKYSLISKFKNSGFYTSSDMNKIDYIQNNLTDLIGPFKRVPIVDVLSCEDDLISSRYNVSSEDLTEELIDVFHREIYVLLNDKPIEIDVFVNNFDEYINVSSFIVKSDSKSYSLCNDLAIDFGCLDKTKFSFNNPLSVINLARKIFIKHNGIIYNICDDLICGRLNRSIEYLFNIEEEKDEWRQNYKERTEGLIKDVMEHYLPGGQYYENNYYRDSHGHLCENDGMYVYHDILFCIEVKGNKFNPDSIIDDTKKVKKSYEDVIGKAKSQILRTKEVMSGLSTFPILNADGKHRVDLQNIDSKHFVGICIYFEDIGTLLAGIPVGEDGVINISFYDLLVVFNYLENPILIAKYFLERSAPINDKRFYINDELIFLSLFRSCIHLNNFINSQKIADEMNGNIGNIFLPNDDFGMEIELYLMTGINKPTIRINNLLKRLITFKDYAALDDSLFTSLFYLVNQSEEDLDTLENKFKSKNKGNMRLPLSFVFSCKDESFAMMIISRGHSPYQTKQNLAYAKRYFEHRKEVDCLYLLEVGKDYTDYRKLKKDSEILVNLDDKALLSDISFSVVEHKLFE